jgi:cytochrome c-type biogenesis protein CcmH
MIVFWLSILIILAFVCAIFYQTLKKNAVQKEENADLKFYKSQLSEIEKDIAKGAIGREEAEQIKVEISRRILKNKNQSLFKFSFQSANSRLKFAFILGGFISFLSFGLYSSLGSLGYFDFSQKNRIEAAKLLKETRPSQQEAWDALSDEKTINTPEGEKGEIITKLRKISQERPNDITGLRYLVRTEASLNNFENAAIAQMSLVKLLGEQVLTEDLYQLAELMVISLNGYVSPEAEALFRKVLAKDDDNGGALYYLGLMYANLDRPDLSFEIWRKLLNRGPGDAPWVPLIRHQIMEVAWRAGKNRYELPPETKIPPNGPTQADIEASDEMAADERQEMISNMVEGLASRLASEGGTSDEWARLIKALSVLGDSDRAKKIWAEALNIYSNSPADLRAINNIAKEIGISR